MDLATMRCCFRMPLQSEAVRRVLGEGLERPLSHTWHSSPKTAEMPREKHRW